MAALLYRYEVRFTLELTADEPEELVEEAITELIDEELVDHDYHGATRCGLTFHDAIDFRVTKEPR